MKPAEADLLAEGREAFRTRRWTAAAELLSAAEERSPLDPDDYQALATARSLIGPDQAASEIWAEAHRVLLERGDVPRAVAAARLAGNAFSRIGEMALSSAWNERGRRLLDDAGLDCVERGYLLLPAVIQANMQGDTETAFRLIAELAAIARRFGDTDLLAFSRLAEGRARLTQGDIASGMAILDEVMLTATTTEISPLVLGEIFCAVLQAAYQHHDLGRARDWSLAAERWSAEQPDLDLYRGECQVFHAHVLQVGGDWPEAGERVAAACAAFLRPPPHRAAGLALYEQGELHRLAGRYQEAEQAFTQAAAHGHSAQPGLALLRLAQGRVDAAAAGIRRALAETPGPLSRARVLPALVEIALAAGELEEARQAADELSEIARHQDSEYLGGLAAEARGAVQLAAGEAGPALAQLRQAAATWQRLDAPYQAAATRLLIGGACRDLGDEEGARLEMEGAVQVFRRLGAEPDARRAQALLDSAPGTKRPLGLTGREVELLALLATGKTNREIAGELHISEKTVARHLSNIFDKLGVSSRTAATAYALKHGLA